MNKLKEKIISALKEAGFSAQAGLSWKKAGPLEQEKICVSIRRAEAKSQVATGYLGTDDQEQEQFALELEVEIGLKVLSPREKGGDGCEQFAQTVFDRLLEGIEGFPAESISLGESGYDSVRDCFTAELRAVSRAVAHAAKTDDSLLIEDIEIRGTMGS